MTRRITTTGAFAVISTLASILAAAPLRAAGAPAPAIAGASAQAPDAAPAPASAPASLDIREIRLENGLRIFVLPRTTSPTFAALYRFRVGGASDPRGRSGVAHLLEHMMFKGTRSIGTLDYEKEAPMIERLSRLWGDLDAELEKQDAPFGKPDPAAIERLRKEIEAVAAEQKRLIAKNEFDELMTRAGGVGLNASTSNDVTTYLIQLPANRLEFWFRLESDRLMNPVFREFHSERDVVLEERRQSVENAPDGRVDEALSSLMFAAHPYGTPVVGWPRDLQRLADGDAMEYLRTWYAPGNCVMVLVGDVSPEEVERLARKYLSGWTGRPIPRLQITAEPEQKGERRGVVEFDAEPRLAMGWTTVPEGHADQYALDVLARILGGLWSSRLDKTVVQEERLADAAYAAHYTLLHGGFFEAGGTPREGRTPTELEAAIAREIGKIRDQGVSAVELERAKIQTEVNRVRSLKSSLGQAFRIVGAVTASGGTSYIQEHEARINAVTAQQVRDAAVKYLAPSRASIVELRKAAAAETEAGGGGAVHQRGGAPGRRGEAHSPGFAEAMAMLRKAPPITLRTPEIGKDVDRVKLRSGPIVFIKEDHSAPSIDMSFAWIGGSNSWPVEDLAPFEVATSLLTEGGTETLDPIALDERKEELGMRFNIHAGSEQCGASFWSLKRNFRESFDLALDMLMRPRLDAERLETLKGQTIEWMRRRGERPSLGAYLIEDLVFNGDHPRLGFTAARKQIEALTPDQIRRIWRRHFGRDNLFVTVVGDFDRKAMIGLLETAFGSWRKAEEKTRKFITREPVVKPGVFLLEKEFPQPAVIVSQHLKVDRTASEADHAAIEVLNEILGGGGFRSRLMERLRSDEGLTYGIYSEVAHQGRPGVPGAISISYQTKKASVARSIDSVVEEYRKIVEEAVSEAEVAEQIDAWKNRFIFRYTNDFYSVARLMASELDDRPYDYDRRELEAVQKVTVDDVRRVAAGHLRPANLTISIYGALTEEDKSALRNRFGLTILRKEDVFKGGYEDEAREKKAEPRMKRAA